MEKEIKIDGKTVVFKKTGGTMLRYKTQTGREFYADLTKFVDVFKSTEDTPDFEKYTKEQLVEYCKAQAHKNSVIEALQNSDFDIVYNILHVMARAADNTVPREVLDWLDTFDNFDAFSIFTQLMPMLNAEMTVDEKNA